MKFITIAMIVFAFLGSAHAGEGVCKARQGQEFAEGICNLQKDGDFCKINPSCFWINLSNQGVCLGQPNQYNMDGVCRLQPKNNPSQCKSVLGCRWIELENQEASELDAGTRSGVCRAKANVNQAMAPLCRSQSKDYCKMNPSCSWIVIISRGVCQNDPNHPHLAALCDGQSGAGEQTCNLIIGCNWIELN